MGLSPHEAPALYSLLQYTEFADGIWFPMGGMYSVIEALTKIAEKNGVKFQYESNVSKINLNENRATGISLDDGRQINSDIIVVNADLTFAYKNLLPKDPMVKKLNNKKLGFSALIFYWAVDKVYPQLKLHNLFIQDYSQDSFEKILKEHAIPDNPNFYVNSPTVIDPSLAPKGSSNIIVAVPMGYLDESKALDLKKTEELVRKKILSRLMEIGLEDLREHIKFEIILNPKDWMNQFSLDKGSTHGLNHNLTQMGYFRPHNRHKKYQNLFFVGASTHPGTGLPTVLISSRLVTERILKEVKAKREYPINQKYIEYPVQFETQEAMIR
jgi:phytoene desaturase